MEQDDQVIGRSARGATVVEGLLALGEAAATHDPSSGIEEPVALAIPTALRTPPVAPTCIGPQLRARRLDHPP
jgi:hypothetical protein